jgi:hypothetical protein
VDLVVSQQLTRDRMELVPQVRLMVRDVESVLMMMVLVNARIVVVLFIELKCVIDQSSITRIIKLYCQ